MAFRRSSAEKALPYKLIEPRKGIIGRKQRIEGGGKTHVVANGEWIVLAELET